MKAKINVTFKTIKGISIDNSLMSKEPRLISSTETTIEKLCDTIVKYFKDYDIVVEVSHKMSK